MKLYARWLIGTNRGTLKFYEFCRTPVFLRVTDLALRHQEEAFGINETLGPVDITLNVFCLKP